jgi:hypothetical protein
LLILVVPVLATQRREDQMARQQDRLTLGPAILNEWRMARMIRLLEALRGDAPQIGDRIGPDAEAVAQPANPDPVRSAIMQTHAAAARMD